MHVFISYDVKLLNILFSNVFPVGEALYDNSFYMQRYCKSSWGRVLSSWEDLVEWFFSGN